MLRALTCLFLFTVYQSATEVDFRVKGVGLGSSHAHVLRQFGKPISSKREKVIDEFEACGPSYTSLRLRYDGAVLELNGDLNGRDFQVVDMEITSSKFLIAPGLRIGMTEAEARSKLGGPPWQETTDAGFRVLSYVTKGNDGGGRLYFRGGRLVKVQWNYVLC